MFLWYGIDISKDTLDLFEKVKEIDHLLDFKNKNSESHLPFHISLKMSFYLDGNNDKLVSEIIEELKNYLKNLSSFKVNTYKIEFNNGIIWLRMKRNEIIDKIHVDLVHLLKDKYNITPHEYDLDFKFHCTLFMDDDNEKLEKAYEMIKDFKFKSSVLADTFCIGKSEDGAMGSYYVIDKVII